MNKIRIVLIEDHDLTRLCIRTMLSQNTGMEIVGECTNATQGLKMLKKLRPDIAIVDIGLPDKNGIELTKEIKSVAEYEYLANTKVLILTQEDSQDLVLSAFVAGADSYCIKNLNFDSLPEIVRVTYKGRSWIDPVIAKVILQQVQQKSSQKLETFGLTERELEVLQLIANGCSNDNIATQLYICSGTVKTHVRNIKHKLGASDRTQAAVIALRSGIVR